MTGKYDHLNDDTPVLINDGGQITISVPVPQVVESILMCNYGLHRFLSCLVQEHEDDVSPKMLPFLSAIRAALDDGAC